MSNREKESQSRSAKVWTQTFVKSSLPSDSDGIAASLSVELYTGSHTTARCKCVSGLESTVGRQRRWLGQ